MAPRKGIVLAGGSGAPLYPTTVDGDSIPAVSAEDPIEAVIGKTRSLLSNTVLMCLRTCVTISISLYASRIVLAELGAVDFGVYFAVAGITLLFSFLNSALATSTQRFLSVEFGRGDHSRSRLVFNASFVIHVAIAVLTLIASETLGLWYVHTWMVIPATRMEAAILAFHLAALSTALTIVQVPFNAMLAAYERFGAFAAFDVLNAVLRLMVAGALMLAHGDLLEVFAALLFAVTALTTVAKIVFCRRVFPSCRLEICRDRSLLVEMSSFAGWSILGAAALVFNIQGVAVLLNLFFGPVANTAQSIALQLSNATSTLSSNLQITSSPQIIRLYASGDHAGFHRLVTQNSKTSFMLMLFLMAPMIVWGDVVLAYWLKAVPDQTDGITRLLLVSALVNSFSFPLMAAAQATGIIRAYQALVGGVMLSAVPLGYLMLTAGGGTLSIFYLLLALSVGALFVRLALLRRLTGLNPTRFLVAVVLPGVATGAVALGLGWAIRVASPSTLTGNLCGFLVTGVVTSLVIYLIGHSTQERGQLRQLVFGRLQAKGGRS